MRWPLPWPNDLGTQIWPRYCEDVPPHQNEVCQLLQKLLSKEDTHTHTDEQTDGHRQTHTHTHDENITSTAYVGGNNCNVFLLAPV